MADLDGARWLVLDLDRPPPGGDPLLADARAIAAAEPRVLDAGWACYLAAPLRAAGGRRAGDAPLDLDQWRRRPGVRRAWIQDDDTILAGLPWRDGKAGFEAGGWRTGRDDLLLIAGPCAVESREQLDEVAAGVAAAGARWLRGGAWKARTSPYDFQGLGARALELLRDAADRHGLAVVTEAIGSDELRAVAELADVVQLGSRNAQNFPLLRKLGAVGKPVLLKRGFGCTLRELEYAAEYVLAHGNPRVLVCERGIRSFESATRFTFDINAVPLLKQRVHLPVIADPAHGTGQAALVEAVARAAIAAGADGLMLEVHPDPARALSDGRQAVPLRDFARVVESLRPVAAAVGRRL
ncbi:MAG TPA: 3-deoxy-7-phosphoheptulonate synthase [Candidatus Krumholzibacteria bacterium]|nr:3-deoxy-7-phosphoheptulonate synthase [Candidatus Krumholzibacteria bacterium]HPD70305.1 3-deoxy-7-phosphoheptulonate synthase [Candidatus Krumholzibacteria bacterium]HRY39995.1 3-deoxy-7-phosphoheptulonate synthase [Candidatus Krumholzibacteria bacterium]